MTFTDMVAYFRARFGVEEGQTMAEYGILVAVIALIAIVGATAFGNSLSSFFNSLGGKL